jgi:hypothetical protein
MTRRTRRFPRLALAVVAVGLAAPATSLGYVDHRSPDAIDSGVQAQKAEQMQNELRALGLSVTFTVVHRRNRTATV